MRANSIKNSLQAELMTGIVEAAVPAICSLLIRQKPAPVTLILTKDQRQYEQWSEDLVFFDQMSVNRLNIETHLLPELTGRSRDDPHYFNQECDRLGALTRLNDYRLLTEPEHPLVILATPRGLFQPFPHRKNLAALEIRLRSGEKFPFGELVEKLESSLRYDCEALCETPGQYAVRGGLVDIYPVNADQPYRIDFFGDEIEEIRAFDPTTQLSRESFPEIVVAALPKGVQQERENHLFDYLGDRIHWIVWEPAILAEAFPAYFPDTEDSMPTISGFPQLQDRREAFPDHWTGLVEIDAANLLFGADCPRKTCLTEPLSSYRTFIPEADFGLGRVEAEKEARLQFLKNALDWQKEGFNILYAAKNQGREKRVETILESDEALTGLQPRFVRGEISEGFLLFFPEANNAFAPQSEDTPASKGIVFLSDTEIFGRFRKRPVGLRRRRLPHRAQIDQMLDFSDLAEGDFLVHLQHGICQYRGLTRLNIQEKDEELISLEFEDSITLHVPLHESHLLTRYVGLTKARPRLGRLGAGAWDRTRRAAEKATLDYAAEMLNLHARRETMKGHAFSSDSQWQQEFEESFPFEETPDQAKAIADTKADMELEQTSDRLICGDVGFGKTEVALRAAFKSVMDGKQVAVLTPTTVLAQQHWNTFLERMAAYPVIVEMLSRFRTKKPQGKIRDPLTTGKVDIRIGTHRLLSGDVRFKDLGILIVDEEHRFGVKHKEKLKHLRENVDVFSMSATPIPRTLYLALMGARKLSLIETPPMDRLPIHTIVKNYDPKLVKEAVEYEVARGGQVFYLHNRVQSIDSVALRLQKMFPQMNIAVGHGQMAETTLEKIMTRFVAGEFDILVCTTIIESGLDIPNCNTIIIEGADRFGLSQLYQLRGRVGRSKRQAYAYLLLHRHSRLVDQARKRLSAMRQYNRLGAGFKIAMRDLELRGAGNLLGTRQSGHIAGVGFELYCQLLRQSIARLKGKKGADKIRATIRLDFISMGGGMKTENEETPTGFAVLKEEELARERVNLQTAGIPRNYIGETRLRIDIHRQLALADTVKAVTEIKVALKDRFGPRPPEVEALLLVTEIRCLAETKNILQVSSEGNRLKCLKATGNPNDFLKRGNRFPRLARRKPLARLREVRDFLKKVKVD